MDISTGDQVKLKSSLSKGKRFFGKVLSVTEDAPHYSGKTYPVAVVEFTDQTRNIMLRNLIKIGR